MLQVQELPRFSILNFKPLDLMSDEEFYDFCIKNRDLHIERTAQGEVIIMAPAGGYSSHRNFGLNGQFWYWIRQDGTGAGFDSSGGFILPNGATYSPDIAWVKIDRLQALTHRQLDRFIPLCPDFALELRSRTDSLRKLKLKMEEYVENGLRLGWLIDPYNKTVWVYRPNSTPQKLISPITVSGDPELPNFTLDLTHIWNPPF